jgi:hypothetical protein
MNRHDLKLEKLLGITTTIILSSFINILNINHKWCSCGGGLMSTKEGQEQSGG